MKAILRNKYILLILIVIVAGSGLLDYFTPVMGDDLKFWRILGQEDYTIPNRQTLWFYAAHVNCCNGRLLDALGPIFINLLPNVLASIVMGCMTGLYFISILLSSGISARRNTSFAIILMAAAMVVTPWWDSMFIRVCQFNYLWGATLCLLFIHLFYKHGKKSDTKTTVTLIVLLGILAGSAHEQTGAAMCASLGLWALYRHHYRNLDKLQRFMLIGLTIGTLITFASPGIWNRAAGESVKEDPLAIIVYSLPVYVILIGVVIGCSATVRGRLFLKKCASDEWMTYITAGGFTALIAIVSGIPGRTGLFSEACALVALARMALTWNPRINKILSLSAAIVSALFVVAHLFISVKTQRTLKGQYDDVIKAYKSSPDGIVFYDYTNRRDVDWLTMYRVKGMADADDVFLLDCLRESYKPEGNIPVVLPEGLKYFKQELADSIVYNDITIYRMPPEHVVETTDNLHLQFYPGSSPRYVTHTTLSDGREVWIATPRVRDPGDYNACIKE